MEFIDRIGKLAEQVAQARKNGQPEPQLSDAERLYVSRYGERKGAK